jgi:uncharacterized membrane-anchored protein YhcB (DUF1043 family)
MAEAPAISVRVKALKAGAANGHRNHCLRLTEDPEHVDGTRTISNTTVVPMPPVADVSAECLRRRQAAFVPSVVGRGVQTRMARKMGKNTTPVISGIVTFSKTAQPIINDLSADEQNRRFKEAAELVAQELGTTLCGLVVHRDESAVHAHFSLHGFGKNGDSVSRKLKKAALSRLQDLGASAYADLGIKRGKHIGQRLTDGDPKHQVVNRSVHQLHNDLPRELAEAEERLTEMQGRVTATEAKLAARERELAAKDDKSAAQDKKLEKLEKRLATYEKRLVDRQAEVDRLAGVLEKLNQDIEHKQQKQAEMAETLVMPKPVKQTVLMKKTGEQGLFKAKTEEKTLTYYTPKQVRQYTGKLAAQLDEEKSANKKLNVEINNKTKGYQHATKRVALPQQSGLEALGGVLVERYGVMVNETPERVSVPPQKPATDAQIGAALYRASRDAGWEKTHFSVNNRVAEKILGMAKADGRLDAISFDKPAQQRVLQDARKTAERAVEETQANGKTSLEIEFERRQRPPEGPDFDDDHGGPSLG